MIAGDPTFDSRHRTGLQNRRSLVRSSAEMSMVRSLARPIFFARTEDIHFDRSYTLSSLFIASKTVMYESGQWVGKSNVESTGKKISWKAWIGALAAMI